MPCKKHHQLVTFSNMKKKKLEKKKIAVWLDHQVAHLIKLKNEKVSVKTIESGKESQVRIEGEGTNGSKLSKTRSSNQEFKTHQREQNSALKYYKELFATIAKADIIYLFGPTTAKEELLNLILKTTPPHKRTFVVDSADTLTFPQMISRAKAVLGE